MGIVLMGHCNIHVLLHDLFQPTCRPNLVLILFTAMLPSDCGILCYTLNAQLFSLSLYFTQNTMSQYPWLNTYLLMQTKNTTTNLKNIGGAGGLFIISEDGRVHVWCEPCLLASSSNRMRRPWGSGEGVLDLPPTFTVITGAWCVGVLWRGVSRCTVPSSVGNTMETVTELNLLQPVRNHECIKTYSNSQFCLWISINIWP